MVANFMPKSLPKGPYILFASLVTTLLVFHVACQSQRAQVPQEKPSLPEIKTMVVVGFVSSMSPWDTPQMVQSPISGAIFFAGPVSEEAVHKMTAILFECIVKAGRYDLISPGQARGVYSTLKLSDVVRGEIEIIQKIGKAFSADAVLSGYIYRWQEREGTDFAANRPASVAFDLYLVRPSDGSILWKGRFDKTQQSLSENVLDMKTFIKGRGRWMRAEKLAQLGLEGLLEELFEIEKGEMD